MKCKTICFCWCSWAKGQPRSSNTHSVSAESGWCRQGHPPLAVGSSFPHPVLRFNMIRKLRGIFPPNFWGSICFLLLSVGVPYAAPGQMWDDQLSCSENYLYRSPSPGNFHSGTELRSCTSGLLVSLMPLSKSLSRPTNISLIIYHNVYLIIA